MTPGTPRTKGRPTIGLLIDWITTQYHAAVLDGIAKLTEERDVNLVVFVAGRLNSEWQTEKCRNIITSFAHKGTCDGLVVCASSMQNLSGYKAMHDFLRSYDIPIVTLHEHYEDIPSVSTDNGRGIRDLMAHLVDDCGYRRFAYLNGVEGNRDVRERFDHFRAFLTEHGIPLDERLIFHGDLNHHSGASAISKLKSMGQNLADVLVCANDSMAIGALQELQKQNWTMAVTGFDNVEPSLFANLTTLDQSVTDLARQAGILLLELIEGHEVPFDSRTAPSLIVRKSSAPNREQVQTAERNDDDLYPGSYRSWSLSEFEMEDIGNVGERLFASLDGNEALTAICEEFPRLGILQCGIALYENPERPLETSRLILAYDRGRRIVLEPDGVRFPTTDLFPPGIFDAKQRRSMVIQSLFRGEEQLGFVAFHLGTHKWRTYEILRKELSIVLKASALVTEVRKYAGNLEVMVEDRTRELQENNRKLEQEVVERRKSEKELSLREAHFRELALLLPTIVLELNLKLRVSFINNAGLEVLEISDEIQIRNKNFLNWVLDEDLDEAGAMFSRIKETLQPASGEFRLRSAIGKSLSVLCQASPIVNGGALEGIRVSAMHIKPVIASLVEPDETFFKRYRFSPRVKEVFHLFIQGSNAREIALKLSISENTAKAHIRAMYIEVGVDNRDDFFTILKEYQSRSFGRRSYLYSLLSGVMKE